jgi:hypothetical protein
MHPDNLMNYLNSHPENNIETNLENWYSEKIPRKNRIESI